MSVVFTRTNPGTYDAATDTYTTPTNTTVSGSAIGVRGKPDRYKALGLALEKMPTLFFTPSDYGLQAYTSDFVQPGDTCVWNGTTFTVKDVDPIAPDGVVIAARIIVGA